MAFVIPTYPTIKRVIKQTFRCACSVGVLAFCLFQPNAVAKQPLTSVADLRYGVALYNYYQDKNLEALTELLVAQQKGGIQGHGDNPEIMEGGFSMAYGMERKASEIFSRLLTANRPQKTRDAAWFNLAKMRYSRQDWDGAEIALDQMSGKPSSKIKSEVEYLRFNLALRQEQLDVAESLIKRNNPWQPYMHFNIGSAYSAVGEYDRGINHYRKLLKMQKRTPEFLALYDKAMTAAGYAHLLKEEYPAATELFSRVRINSPFSSRALLGYGWAAAEQNDYLLALKPWTELSKRKLIDQNTQEVQIAIPYAYEKMDRQGRALLGFQAAEANFLHEILVLDTVIQSMPDYAIRDALNIDRSTDINMLEYAEDNSLSPQLSYLVELFSREDFLALVQELRDLLAIQTQYKEWQNKLGFYSHMIDERESNRSQQVSYVVQEGLQNNISKIEQQRNAFAETIADLQKNNNFLSLVSSKNTGKLKRILNAEKNIQLLTLASTKQNMQVMPEEELKSLSETLRKLKGFMIWNSQALYEERLWRAKFELAQVNQNLLSMKQTQMSVQSIVSQSQDLQSFRDRISAANRKLSQQNTEVTQDIEFIQNKLRRKILHVLQLHRVRLKHYLAQSRLSVARLLDQAAAEQTSGTIDDNSSMQKPLELEVLSQKETENLDLPSDEKSTIEESSSKNQTETNVSEEESTAETITGEPSS